MRICEKKCNFVPKSEKYKYYIPMILDKLENADWYYDSVPGLKEFMKFYNENDLEKCRLAKFS